MNFIAVAKALNDINSSLENEDEQSLLHTLLSPHAGLINVDESNALHYFTVLKALKTSKMEVQCITMNIILQNVNVCLFIAYVTEGRYHIDSRRNPSWH